MKVVANAGPLMALGKLGLIHGLELEQPDAYAVELAIARQEIRVVDINDADLAEAVRILPLGKGEKQTIQLGLKEASDWVLLDDLLAREEAQRLGLKVKGTLGIIAEACRQGLMTFNEADLVLQAIVAREDIWISEALARRVRAELEKTK